MEPLLDKMRMDDYQGMYTSLDVKPHRTIARKARYLKRSAAVSLPILTTECGGDRHFGADEVAMCTSLRVKVAR